MSTDDTPLTVRVPLPYDIPRGRAHTITAPLYRDGALVPATAVTCRVVSAAGTTLTLTSAASVVDDIATQAIASGDLSSEPYGDDWRVEWEITHAGGVTDSRHEAALVRSALYPVITDDDLYRRHRMLDASAGARAGTTRTDYQDAIDEAWTEIMLRLISVGRRPWLVMSPSALRECHLALTLSIVFGDLGSGQSALQYADHSAMYRMQYEAAWGRLSLRYDEDDDGDADPGRVSGPSTIWLMGRM